MWIGSKAAGEYLALSLVRLLRQIDALAPRRDKSNDGSIGDAAHQATHSEHNPDANGVVRAMDITHDPTGGFDSYAFAEHLRTIKDPRVRYVISNSRITGTAEFVKANPHYHCPGPWQWGKYDGKNPHDHHVHITVSAERKLYDDEGPWNLTFSPLPDTPPTPKRDPVLKIGSTGDDVRRMQALLGFTGVDLDGQFGSKTDAAVRNAQFTHGLVVDGIVGPATWATLKAHPKNRGK